MRVLLIGGSGFIGSHLVDAFLCNGMNIVVLDHRREKFRPPNPKISFVQGDMSDRTVVEEIIAGGCDRVILLASSTIPHTSNQNRFLDVQTNMLGTIAVLDLCVKHKVDKVLFASSGGTVYGVPRSLPITEDHPTDPYCSYGIVKLAIEKYLHLYYHLFGLKYLVFRLSNPYGIRQDPNAAQGIISVFAARMLQGKTLTLWGDGSAVRDFVHVTDVADLFCTAIRSDAVGIFNVGSGVGVTINDLLSLISSRLHTEPLITREPSRKADVPAIILDCDKATRKFQWTAKRSLERGIDDIAYWLRTEGSDGNWHEKILNTAPAVGAVQPMAADYMTAQVGPISSNTFMR